MAGVMVSGRVALPLQVVADPLPAPASAKTTPMTTRAAAPPPISHTRRWPGRAGSAAASTSSDGMLLHSVGDEARRRTVFAHTTLHEGIASQLVRWGPLSGLAVVLLAVVLHGEARGRERMRLFSGVCLGVAGLVHMVLVREHAREQVVAGVFFFVSGLAE